MNLIINSSTPQPPPFNGDSSSSLEKITLDIIKVHLPNELPGCSKSGINPGALVTAYILGSCGIDELSSHLFPEYFQKDIIDLSTHMILSIFSKG